MNKKATILIVDDEPLNIKTIADQLKSEYDVLVATSGEIALSLLDKSIRPDLILLDVVMPEMDGYETCRHLKNDTRLSKVPIIFLTAKDADEDEALGLSLGAVDFLKKPFRPSVDLQRIQIHLSLANSFAIENQAESDSSLSSPTSLSGNQAESLSEREREVLILLSKGLTRKEIAGLLNISPYTINDHVKSIYKKLDVNSKSEVTRIAMSMGFV